MGKIKINTLNEEVCRHILGGLSSGLTESEVCAGLKKKGIKPNSIRTVDLYLAELRERNGCKTTFELMYRMGQGKKVRINE